MTDLKGNVGNANVGNSNRVAVYSEAELTEYFEENKPSTAYARATESPVYRLAESMFWSILAAYILGFIGVSAGGLSGGGRPAMTFMMAAAISASYAYLTANFYLTYQASILTMFYWNLSRLRWDFDLALGQAMAFGISLLFPETFWLATGLIIALAFTAQRLAFRGLVRALWEKRSQKIDVKYNRQDQPATKQRRRFKNCVRNAIEGRPPLAPWAPPRALLSMLAGITCTAGIVIAIGFHLTFQAASSPVIAPLVGRRFIVLFYLNAALSVIVVGYCHRGALKHKAGFLGIPDDSSHEPSTSMDVAFRDFLGDVMQRDKY